MELYGRELQDGALDLSGLAQLRIEDLQQLGRGVGLKILNLEDSPVQDDWLPVIAALSELEELNLRSTAITDVGLAHLEYQPRGLRWLYVAKTQITAQGLARLKSARQQGGHLTVFSSPLPTCYYQTRENAPGFAWMPSIKPIVPPSGEAEGGH
jgi:hypothetical protein